MSAPLVSIVIPTYDRAGFVETAIDSVLDQDWAALELIVLDDGSNDETPALLARIAERADPARFRWERHANMGQAATINRGLAQARGELLGYLSSDDYLLPGAISKLVAAAQAHPDADVVYPWFRVVDAADRVLDVSECAQHTFADALRWALCMPGVGVLVRRRLYERVGGWNPAYRFCPDYEWWLRARDARFVRVPEPLGVWRAHDSSISIGELGLGYVRERMRLLEEVYAQEDLPAEIAAIEREAYATMLIHCGTALTAVDDGSGPQRRYVVEDRLGPLHSQRAREADAGERLALTWQLRSAEHQLACATEVIGQLEQTVVALRDTAAHRTTPTAVGTNGSNGRPPWLRAARALTPPALRPRVGAAVHRVRSARR